MTRDEQRRQTIDKARADVERTVQDSREAMHRGIDAKYNLMRLSERRWSIIRVASTATITFGIADVVTFEQVSGPLAFEAALAELRRKRGL